MQDNSGDHLKKFYDFNLWTNSHISFLTQYHLVLFAVSSAALGFEANLLIKDNFMLSCTAKVFFTVSVVALLASIGLSLFIFKKRSANFRKNAQIARNLAREKGIQILLEETDAIYKTLGKLSSGSFYFLLLGQFV